MHHCACRVCQDGNNTDILDYHRTINLVLSRLSEAQRRWYAASLVAGPNGLSMHQVAVITGLDRKTIRRGKHELATGLADAPSERQRCVGGGRHSTEKKSRNWCR
jgi:chromosome segregation and condensation protein ScpB